ncbi:MAG TPA: hypothetical protein VH592_20785 [Gemmataceae bacterium]
MRRLRVRDSGNREGHGGEVFSCVYSDKGPLVLSTRWDGRRRLWLSVRLRLLTSPER